MLFLKFGDRHELHSIHNLEYLYKSENEKPFDSVTKTILSLVLLRGWSSSAYQTRPFDRPKPEKQKQFISIFRIPINEEWPRALSLLRITDREKPGNFFFPGEYRPHSYILEQGPPEAKDRDIE